MTDLDSDEYDWRRLGKIRLAAAASWRRLRSLLPISWAAGCTGRERDHLLTTVVTERNASSFTETTATEGRRLQQTGSSDQGTYGVSTHFVTSRLLLMFIL